MQAYSLTPTEAKVASLITKGLTVAEVANEMGVSRETAKTHLQAIYFKTDTHRQSELVALLARS